MARIRTIKPEFFRNVKLYRAEQEEGLPLRLAFAGLWTACDRSGRFKWCPEELKLDAMPFDQIDFSRVLDALTTRGYIVKFCVEDEVFGQIPSWDKHQVINNREKASDLPDVSMGQVIIDASPTRDSRVTEIAQGKGKEGKGKEGKGTNTTAVAVAPAVEVDPLFQPLMKSFLSVTETFSNYAKEGAVCKGLCTRIRSLSPDEPMAAAKLLLETYRSLVNSGDKFWSGQPFTPSGLSPLLDRVWAQARKNNAPVDQELAEALEGIPF